MIARVNRSGSRRFTFDTTSGLFVNQPAVTGNLMSMACWFWTPDNASTMVLMVQMTAAGNTVYHGIRAAGAVAGDPVQCMSSSGVSEVSSSSTFPYQINQWQHVVGTWDAAAARLVYLNGIAGTAEATVRAVGTPTKISIGVQLDLTANNPFNGYIALPAIWNGRLGAGEIAALAAGEDPRRIRPGKLIVLWDFGLTAGSTIPPVHGHALFTLTALGASVAAQPQPGIAPPPLLSQRVGPIHIWRTPSTAVTTPQSLSATLLSVVTMTLRPGKLLSATAAAVATLVRQITARLSATSTATGTLVKRISKALAATALGTGTLATRLATILTATAVGTGTIVRRIGTTLSATSLATAALFRRIPQSMAATSAAVATMTRRITAALSATLTGTGQLFKRMPQALAATALGTGTITTLKAFRQSLSATLAAVATLTFVMTLRRTLSATSTATGTITRQITKALTATLTAVASLFKRAPQALSATLLGIGTASTITARRLSLAATALGTATLTSVKTFLTTLAASSAGAATITFALTRRLTLTATNLAVATLARLVAFHLTLSGSAVAGAVLSLRSTFPAGARGYGGRCGVPAPAHPTGHSCIADRWGVAHHSGGLPTRPGSHGDAHRGRHGRPGHWAAVSAGPQCQFVRGGHPGGGPAYPGGQRVGGLSGRGTDHGLHRRAGVGRLHRVAAVAGLDGRANDGDVAGGTADGALRGMR